MTTSVVTMIFCLIAIAVTTQKEIALEHRVVRVPELVAELASKSSESLVAAANLKNEVVYMNLKARGVMDLMKLIAEVTGCEWIRREDRIELTRTTQKLREDEARERQWDLQKVTNAMAKMTPPADPISKANVDGFVKKMTAAFTGKERISNPYEYVESFRPVRRMLYKILTHQPPAWALTIPPGTPGTFVEAPNRFQKALPVRLRPLMNSFVEEDRTLRRAIDSAEITGVTMRGDVLGYLNDKAAADFTSPLTPFVSVKRSADFMEIILQIVLPQGLELVSASSSFALVPDGNDKNVLAEALPANELLPADPDSPRLGKRLNPKTDAKTLALLRKPLDVDPLKLTLETPLKALFQKAGKEAILSLNDDLAIEIRAKPEGITSSEIIRIFHETMAVEARGNLLVGRPRHAHYMWNTRADRAVMQNLIARSPFGAPVPLDSLAEYVAKQTPMAGVENFECTWLSYAIRGKPYADEFTSLGLTFGLRDSLRLWGGLGKAQKELLRSGGEIDANTLPAASRSALTALLFDREVFLMPNSDISRHIPLSMLLPNGILPGTSIQSTSKAELSVVYETKEGHIDSYQAASAAYVLAQQEVQQFLDPAFGYLVMEGALYRPLQVKSLSLKVKITPDVDVMIYLKDYAFDPSVEAVPWQKLKGAEGDQFRKSLESSRKQLGGGGGG